MSQDYFFIATVEPEELRTAADLVRSEVPNAFESYWMSDVFEVELWKKKAYDLRFDPKSSLTVSWNKGKNSEDIGLIVSSFFYLLGRNNVTCLLNGSHEIDFFGNTGKVHHRYSHEELLSEFISEFVRRIPADHPWRVYETER